MTALALALMVTKFQDSRVFSAPFSFAQHAGRAGLRLYLAIHLPDRIFPNSVRAGIPLANSILQNMTQDNTKALFALAILVTWQMAGYMMIIYITGLNNIPYDLYEAAEIDGASTFQRFRVITLPMLMPAFTVVFFLTLANCFKLLDQNIALTDGAFGTRMLATQILRTIKDTTPPNYGQAQAQAVIFFVLIAVVTLIQVLLRKSGRWRCK